MAQDPSHPDDDLIQRRRELIVADINRSFEVSSALFRWMIASTLLLNGGALVALLGVEDLRTSLARGVGWLFAGGIVSALMAGLGTAHTFAGAGVALIERLWADDEMGQSTYEGFYKRSKAVSAMIVLGPLFLCVSIGCFVQGCVEVAKIASAESPSRSVAPSEATSGADASVAERNKDKLLNSNSGRTTSGSVTPPNGRDR